MIVDYQLVPWVFMYHLSIYKSPWHLYISIAFIIISLGIYISPSVFIYLPQYLYISLGIDISPSVFIYFTGHLYKFMDIYTPLGIYKYTLLSNYETHGIPYFPVGTGVVCYLRQHKQYCRRRRCGYELLCEDQR